MKIQFKDIRIKHFADDLPLRAIEDSPIPEEAYGVRPQGQPKKGWKAPVRGKR